MTDQVSTSVDLSAAMQHWLDALLGELKLREHRAALVLQGDTAMTLTTLIADSFSAQRCLWLSSQIEDALPVKQATTQLGREYDCIVFDARDGFAADAFGAVSGTLCGGGLLLLLLPAPTDELITGSVFMRRLLRKLQAHPAVYWLHDQQVIPPLPESAVKPSHVDVAAPFRTLDQQQAVQAVVDGVLNQHTPWVLISDRGRGKSSALGLAAAQLMQQGVKHIVVTAPRLSIADPLFQHAAQQLPGVEQQRGHLHMAGPQLDFMAPDALLLEQPEVDVLMVDEAAAIPLSMLKQFLRHYPQTIFATTVHGYEGTGRGFAVKFRQLLDDEAEYWQQISMHTPIRWAQDDPLEHCVDTLLCMDAELADVPAITQIDVRQCRVECITREQFLQQDDVLSNLFALLVSAHYRTQPSDLQHLLDDAQVRVYVLFYQQHLLGAVLVNQEGGFDEQMSELIFRGERRPQGHLLAQTLCFHGGYQRAAELKFARIMRIAIHPQVQRHGLGSLLLQGVIEREQQYELDAIGTSFGATPELLRFWQSAGLIPVRMGFTRDHASGQHSAVLLKAFSAAGQDMVQLLADRFRRYINCWLQGPLRDLEDALKQFLQIDAVVDQLSLSQDDMQVLHAYAETHRGMESCLWPLMKLVSEHGSLIEQLGPRQAQVIRARLLRHLDWSEAAQYASCAGRAEAQQVFRQGIADLLQRLET